MRRLRTYALGGHFIEPHIFILFFDLFGLSRGFPLEALGDSSGAPGRPGAHLLCAGCVDPRRLHFL